MTLPRELSVKDGRLIQNPVRELAAYRVRRVLHQNIPVSSEINLPSVQGRVLDMTVVLRPGGSECYRWFRICVAKDGEYQTMIRYRPDQGTLKLDRTRSGIPHDIVHTRSFFVRSRDGEIKSLSQNNPHTPCLQIFSGSALFSLAIRQYACGKTP